MKQVHLLISGLVQGVGFRNFVNYSAKKIGVAGWVRNLSDKRVEVLAQGEDQKLKEFVEACSRGPMLSEIKSVAIDWQEITETFDSFKKRPTV